MNTKEIMEFMQSDSIYIMNKRGIELVMIYAPHIEIKDAEELYIQSINEVLEKNHVQKIEDIGYGLGYIYIRGIFSNKLINLEAKKLLDLE